MKKKNFMSVDKLRDEIVAIHKQAPNAIVQINHSAAIALDALAKKRTANTSCFRCAKVQKKGESSFYCI